MHHPRQASSRTQKARRRGRGCRGRDGASPSGLRRGRQPAAAGPAARRDQGPPSAARRSSSTATRSPLPRARSIGRRSRPRTRSQQASYCCGGGHAGLERRACYDCSGSVSYALHGRPLLDARCLERLDELGAGRQGPVDHRLRQRQATVHGGRRPALRHLDDRRRRPGLEQGHAPAASGFRKQPQGSLLRRAWDTAPAARGLAAARPPAAVRLGRGVDWISGEPALTNRPRGWPPGPLSVPFSTSAPGLRSLCTRATARRVFL